MVRPSGARTFGLLLSIYSVVTAFPSPLVKDVDPSTIPDIDIATAAYSSVASLYASMLVKSAPTASPPIPILPQHPMSEQLTSLANAPLMQAKVDVESFSRTFNALHEHAFNGSARGQLSPRAGQKRVMIVGDSMTQGSAGDWTWRYRIWQWAQLNGLNFQFVGPYVGTQHAAVAQAPQAPPLYGSSPAASQLNTDGGYAADCDPAFLQDGGYNHFSIWGRAVAFDISTQPGDSVPLIQKMVQQYQPDIILLMLGFNDVGWFYSDGQGLLNNMGTMVQQIRTANPNAAIALANVVQRRWLGRADLVQKTNYYNSRIQSYIDGWTTTQSPVRLVHLQENYDCGISSCPAGSDGLHPNSLGDFQIAQAFSRALAADPAAFSLSPNVQPLSLPNPMPKRRLPVPTNLVVKSSQYGVTATWNAVYGAYGYKVHYQIDDGPVQNALVQANRLDTVWPFDGHKYAYSVAATAGDYDNSDYTSPQSAIAASKIAAGPINPRSQPYGDGLRVDWDAPTGPNSASITEYQIIIWDRDSQCAFISGAAFKSSPAIITGLNAGHRYLVAPASWNEGGLSFPTFANDVRVGAGTPATPSTPQLQAIDQVNIHATWNGDVNAAGWTVFGRNINNASDFSRPLPVSPSRPCADLGILYPGYWNYEICLQAYNGNNKLSGKSGCTVLPSPTASIVPAATCQADPPWCPGFGMDTTPSGGSGSLGDGGGEGGAPPPAPTASGAKAAVTITYVPSPTASSLGPWATGSWTSITCGAQPSNTNLANGARLGDVAGNPAQATAWWQDSGADAALTDLLNGFSQTQNVPFEIYILRNLYMYTGSSGGSCGDITSAGCLAAPRCTEQYNSPALFYIAQSFIQLNQLYTSFAARYTQNLIEFATSTSYTWADTFVQNENQKDIKIEQALLGFISGTLSIPVGRVFQPLEQVLGKTLSSNSQLLITQGIAQGITAASNNLTAASKTVDYTFHLNSLVVAYYQAVQAGAEYSLKSWFNGSYSAQLPMLFKDGGFALISPSPSYGDTFNEIARIDLNNFAFQNGWSIDTRGYNVPYIMMIPYYAMKCSQFDYSKIQTIQGDVQSGAVQMTGQRDKQTLWCDAADNGYLLYNGGYVTSQHGSSAVDTFHTFPRMDALQGNTATWANIKVKDIVSNAVRGFNKKGFRNDGPPAVYFTNPFSYRLPDGYFNFPVCTSLDGTANAIGGIANGKTTPYPPCSADGYAGRSQAGRAYLKSTYGYAPGSCSIPFRVNDGNADPTKWTADFYFNDNFNQTIGQDFPGTTFVNGYTLNLSPGLIGTMTITIDPRPDAKTHHELLTFSINGTKWSSTDDNCEQRSYDKDKQFWTGRCVFKCGNVP